MLWRTFTFYFLICLPVVALGLPKDKEVLRACESLVSEGKLSQTVASCVDDYNRGVRGIYTLVGVYFLGNGEFENAEYLFRQEAEAGDPVAQNGLGYLYQFGHVVKRDYDKANEYFLKSAEQGNVNSQFWFGENLILSGDYINGFLWTEKAARNGNANAQYNLGVLYKDGKGIEYNVGLMYFWLSLAAQTGDSRATDFIAELNSKLPDSAVSELAVFVQEQLSLCPSCIKR